MDCRCQCTSFFALIEEIMMKKGKIKENKIRKEGGGGEADSCATVQTKQKGVNGPS